MGDDETISLSPDLLASWSTLVIGYGNDLRGDDAIGPRVAELVTARAFAPLEELLGYAEPFFEAGATGLFHKGQDVDTELTQAAKSWKISAKKHSSATDSQAVLLEVKEISHVDR